MDDAEQSPSSGYLAMLNAEPAVALPESTASKAPATRGRKPASKGVVDSAKKPGRKAGAGKPGPKPRKRDEGGIREL